MWARGAITEMTLPSQTIEREPDPPWPGPEFTMLNKIIKNLFWILRFMINIKDNEEYDTVENL